MSPASAADGQLFGDNDGAAAAAPDKKMATRKRSTKNTAEQMATRQREISVSEFFTKNRHLLGFDSPRKALLTAIKEAVDNSLDACEEARILPQLKVAVRKGKRENVFTMVVEDNGPGIVRAQVPHIFGRLLYGSKFHRLRQSRGQQGIGISAAGMYGQLTTGNPMRIRTRTSKRAIPHDYLVRIDTAKNKPEFKEKALDDWEGVSHGTRVEIDMEGEYRRGVRSVEEFLKLVAVANPHVRFEYTDPDDNVTIYERGTEDLPKETDEIKPHPHGVELGLLIKMLGDAPQKQVSAFLKEEFSRVGPKVANDICDKAGIKITTHPKRIAKNDAENLKSAIDTTRIMAPPTSCIAPIGEEQMLAGLKKEVAADFYIAATRSPAVYRGHPFQVECGIAYGRPGDTLEMLEGGKIVESAARKKRKTRSADEEMMGFADEPARVVRYANRVPLLYQQTACAVHKAIVATNWRGYGLSQPRGAVPVGPLVIMVHIASVWVPFTSESKEAIASYDEILKELKLAIQECGRKLGTHIRKGKKLAGEFKKRNYIQTYIPHIGLALQEILELSDKQTESCVSNLTEVLEKSRKL